VIGASVPRGSRDVIDVIVSFRHALNEVTPQRCPDVAAEYLRQLFEGSAAAVNLMDYGRSRYQTLSNVGQLTPGEVPTPQSEFYPFSDFPFTTQHLARGGAYRSTLRDPDCPQEYRELLTAQRRTDCLGAPIRLEGRALGEFWVAREDGRPFDDVDEDLAVACGATLARFFRPSWATAG
jgi:GAF domain-containing protein